MNTTLRVLKLLVACAAAVVWMSPADAGDADGQRDISPYDKNPACLERGQLRPGQSGPCELQAPQPDRRRVVRAPAVSGDGGIAQGDQQGQRAGGASSNAGLSGLGQAGAGAGAASKSSSVTRGR